VWSLYYSRESVTAGWDPRCWGVRRCEGEDGTQGQNHPWEGRKGRIKNCTVGAAATKGVKEWTDKRIKDPHVLGIFLHQRVELREAGVVAPGPKW